jgi:hypothetical protein
MAFGALTAPTTHPVTPTAHPRQLRAYLLRHPKSHPVLALLHHTRFLFLPLPTATERTTNG